MIHVAGGTYLERCIQPSWDQLFGSGGRAAAALAGQTPVEFFTYIEDGRKAELEARLRGFGKIELHARIAQETPTFDYAHPLAAPVVYPRRPATGEPWQVEGDVVLRFGMLEGDAIVAADRAIYDPQSPSAPRSFRENGSTASRLAVVANVQEIRLLSGMHDIEAGATHVLKQESAETVVVKCGARGAMVFTAHSRDQVPAYKTAAVFSLGSGDVFAAAFAYFWGVSDLAPSTAAQLASRATALYCESRAPVVPPKDELDALTYDPVTLRGGRVYLAGPFFCLAERWLVEEARSHLRGMGLDVFSPLHDVGPGSASEVAPADLEGLKQCDRMLALLDGGDPGTIFEVGYARSQGKPVIALSQTLTEEELKMIVGSGCTHVEDFATALYFTAWL